ncbi:hypothetical protein Tsubulata_029113 [Turnera subulata]|uniref:RING-type domain-containing protein n=1 Tax=Turnera subulata TaxID=218843 RepID=A0A9Q0JHG8_9ROSI|nr:hypothetical protein Tsubulata_029113 [Turnera subulata]
MVGGFVLHVRFCYLGYAPFGDITPIPLFDLRSGDRNTMLDCNGDEEELSSSGVSCSICLDMVLAKPQCGHLFHLDCIGYAFSMQGSIQCPNCRKIEKDQCYYANGSARWSHELGMEVWVPDEDFYDPSFPETVRM